MFPEVTPFIEPPEMVMFAKFAPLKFEPSKVSEYNTALLNEAFEKLVLVNVELEIVAPWRLTPERLNLLRVTP